MPYHCRKLNRAKRTEGPPPGGPFVFGRTVSVPPALAFRGVQKLGKMWAFARACYTIEAGRGRSERERRRRLRRQVSRSPETGPSSRPAPRVARVREMT